MVGGYAEYVAIEDDNVALVPEGVELQDAAIVACAIGTILDAIREIGKLQPGETALVTGAGGGLGMHAIQLARLAGALVIAQTTSPEKADRDSCARRAHGHSPQPRRGFLKRGQKGERGARGRCCNRQRRQPAVRIRSAAASEIGGRWIMIGQLTGEFVPFNPAQLFSKNVSMLSATSTTRKQLDDCLALVARGVIKPFVSLALPLEQAAQAHELVETGKSSGRIVLRPNG